MNRHAPVIAAAVVIAGFGIDTSIPPVIDPGPAPATVAAKATECHEDEPCWDCHTMGNRICGSELPAVPRWPTHVDPGMPPVVGGNVTCTWGHDEHAWACILG